MGKNGERDADNGTGIGNTGASENSRCFDINTTPCQSSAVNDAVTLWSG